MQPFFKIGQNTATKHQCFHKFPFLGLVHKLRYAFSMEVGGGGRIVPFKPIVAVQGEGL